MLDKRSSSSSATETACGTQALVAVGPAAVSGNPGATALNGGSTIFFFVRDGNSVRHTGLGRSRAGAGIADVDLRMRQDIVGGNVGGGGNERGKTAIATERRAGARAVGDFPVQAGGQ